MLAAEAIPFQIEPTTFGTETTPHLLYPTAADPVCSVICHRYAYGYGEGRLEIMGLVDEEAVGDEVEGHLTAENVFKRIYRSWTQDRDEYEEDEDE